MMGGIESILRNKVDANRGNPAALQSSYQNNQQLLDLLALQKLKSEKEAAKRDMLLKANQSGTPPTVAQSRENEMMDVTRQELAQQAGQGGQKMVNDQQQAMQRMLSGVAGLPASNMSGMYEGGIVGYAEGGRAEVSDEIVGYDGQGNPIYASQLARIMNAGRVDETEEGDARRAEYARLQEQGERSRADMRAAASGPMISIGGEVAPTSAPKRGGYGLDEMAVDGWNMAKRVGSAASEGIASLAQNIPGMSDNEIAQYTTSSPRLTEVPTVQPRQVATAPTPARAQPATVNPIEDKPDTPVDYLLRATASQRQPGGIASLPQAGQDDYSRLMARRQAELDRMDNPAMRRRRVLAAALQGGGQGVTIADSLSGMGQGASAEADRLDQQNIERLNAMIAPLEADRTAQQAQDFELEQINREGELRLEGVERQVAGRLAENAQQVAASSGISPSLVNDIITDVEAAITDPMQATRMRAQFMADTGVRERDMEKPEVAQAYGQWLDNKIQSAIQRRIQMIGGRAPQSNVEDPETDELVRMYTE